MMIYTATRSSLTKRILDAISHDLAKLVETGTIPNYVRIIRRTNGNMLISSTQCLKWRKGPLQIR